MLITHHSLYISDPEQSLGFYLQYLGMHLIEQYQSEQCSHYMLEFPCYDDVEPQKQHAKLELIYDPQQQFTVAKQPSRIDGYWKFTIAVGHLKTARQNLIDAGVAATPCFEIPNLAYLCHIEDPDGYAIELIQTQRYENTQRSLISSDSRYPLGSKAHFNLSTLKVKDINTSLTFYRTLGLELVYSFRSNERGMWLYFLANSHSPAYQTLAMNQPNDSQNIPAIIEELLWQYPETLLELQAFDGTAQDPSFSYQTSISTGFVGLTIRDDNTDTAEPNCIPDPDGYLITRLLR